MPYLELSFDLAGLDPEWAQSACFGCGALSVTLSEARDDAVGDVARYDDSNVVTASSVLEPGVGEVRLWAQTRVQALFAAENAAPALLAALAGAVGVEPQRLRARAVADRVWEREWLRDFHAMRFGQRLWVCPRHESVPQPDAVVVRLDPGLAFGTGTHASTALCLEWLEGCALAGRQVIDFGSGSGVLAVAALKLGARRAYAFDIDPQALLATRDNAADNGVAARLEVCERTTQLPRDCDVLLANILSGILQGLAPTLAPLVAPGGSALLAGILAGQEAEVAASYSPWFDMRCHAQREGWIALHGQRH
jgi:ribosomal protein L11 methyltransferase